MAAGLLAKKAVEKGLKVSPTVKTSLAPGSKVVTGYLKASGLQTYLDKLGFNLVGYGCTTCIGNSGDLRPEVAKAIVDTDLLASAVLSGNRNFEGRINPLVKANFLASPPLVVAYALAGNTNIDLTTEPLGFDDNGQAVYLEDVMKYKEANQDTLVIAGKDYGMGSSRDWAAKGANLLGVKVVLAESFERIHRSNLVMMGILPVQFMEGENAESLGLTGHETFSFDLSENPGVHDVITVTASTPEQTKTFKALVRFDADADIRYYKNGGILPMVVRKKLKGA